MAAQRNAFVTVTRASLTFAAALSLARVFDGGAWIGAVAVAAAVPPLLFALGTRRRWNLFAQVILVATVGALLAILVDTPSETVAGIPTGTALSTFANDLSNAPHVLRTAVVPVSPGGAALVLAFLATFFAAAVADLAARHLDAPIGAIGASVALYVAIAALGSGRWAPTTGCYALALVAYLVALHNAELSARRTWFQSGRNRRSQLLTGGLIAGTMVVAFSVAIGPSFPGASGRALINYRKLGSGHGANALDAPSPFLSIASKLTRDANTEVFTVADGGVPYRWRLIALDDFNHGKSDEWGLGDTQGSVSDLPKATKGPGTSIVQQEVHITAQIDPYWLPAAYQPVKIDVAGVSVLPGSTTLYVNRPIAGQQYKVESEIRTPSAAALRSVTVADLAPMAKDTQLPDNFSPRIAQLARDLTANAKTPYDKAAALESFFQGSEFTYDQSVNYEGDPHALETFVLVQKRGFCEQFSAAFAEMARSVGLPTRVAVGFQPGTLIDGLFHVRGEDAHAWPEVWLGAKIGWYAFEPTKGRADPVTGRGDPRAVSPQTTPRQTTPPSKPSNTTPNKPPVTSPPKNSNNIHIDQNTPKSTHASPAHRALVGIGILAAVALFGAVCALIALFVAASRRTRRRRDAPDTRRRVLGAWAEALERLASAGVSPRPSATSIEFALRHAPAHGAGGAGPPLMDLARLHTAAMFSPDAPSEDDAVAAWRDVDEIALALRADVSRSERVITRLRIRPRDRRVLVEK